MLDAQPPQAPPFTDRLRNARAAWPCSSMSDALAASTTCATRIDACHGPRLVLRRHHTATATAHARTDGLQAARPRDLDLVGVYIYTHASTISDTVGAQHHAPPPCPGRTQGLIYLGACPRPPPGSPSGFGEFPSPRSRRHLMGHVRTCASMRKQKHSRELIFHPRNRAPEPRLCISATCSTRS